MNQPLADPKIYLDNNASTLLDPRIVNALIAQLQAEEGNPSSLHSFGQAARASLNQARRSIAAFLKVKPTELIFTSGGTEGANMILRGYFPCGKRGHLITSNTEHSSVYTTAKVLEKEGVSATFLESGLYGAATPEAVEAAIRPETRLIALMAVNNETGVKTDIPAVAAIAKAKRIPFFVDGVAWLGKELFDIPEGVTALCFSGHKIHAPAGTGFVYLRSTRPLPPLLLGGEQEFGRRGGTENILGIVALGEAVRLLAQELPDASIRMVTLRDRLESGLMQRLAGVTINGLGPRIANVTNLSFAGIEGETLLAQLDLAGIAASHGSACASGALEPSRILRNMGLSAPIAASAIRFSLSRMTTPEEIDRAVAIISELVTKLRPS